MVSSIAYDFSQINNDQIYLQSQILWFKFMTKLKVLKSVLKKISCITVFSQFLIAIVMRREKSAFLCPLKRTSITELTSADLALPFCSGQKHMVEWMRWFKVYINSVSFEFRVCSAKCQITNDLFDSHMKILSS